MDEFENNLNRIINDEKKDEITKAILIKKMLEKISEEELVENAGKIIYKVLNIENRYKRTIFNEYILRLPIEKLEEILISIFSIKENRLSSLSKQNFAEDIIDLLNDNEFEKNINMIIKTVVDADKENFQEYNKGRLVLNIMKKSTKEIQLDKIENILDEIMYADETNYSRWNKESTIIDIIQMLNQEVIKDKLDIVIEKIISTNVENLNILSKLYIVVLIIDNVSSEAIDFNLENIIKVIVNANEESLKNTDKETIIENIIDKLPQENLEKNIRKILELSQNRYNLYNVLIKKTQESKNVEVLKEIPEDKLDESLDYTNFYKWAELLEEILKNENNIVQNDFIIHIFNLSQNSIEGRTKEEKEAIEKIKSSFEKISSKYSYPDMSQFDTKVSNFEKMDQEEFEKFIKNIENLKIKTGKIPEKYCDYIIKQKLISGKKRDGDIYFGVELDKNMDKYLYIIKRAFEDKAIHLLENEGISNYIVKFANLTNFTLGNHSEFNKVINFDLDMLIDLNIENAKLVNTMFHEIEHAKQIADITAKDINKVDGIKYNIIKEKFIKKEDIAFYDANYQRMYEEIGARIEGSKEQSKYLLYLGFSPEQIISSDDRIELKESYEKAKEIEKKNLERAQKKVGKQAEIISTSQKFLEIMLKKTPGEIEKIFEEYPVLQLEFEKDGTRKKISKIFEEINNSKELSDTQIEIYMEIFKENIKLDYKTFFNDIRTIRQYKNYNNINAELMNNFIEQIVKNEIFESIKNSYDSGSIMYSELLLRILNDFANENPELSVSKWISSQVDEYGRTGKLKQEQNDYEEDKILKTIVKKRKKDMYLSSSTIQTLEEFERIINEIVSQDFAYFDLQEIIEALVKDKLNYSNIKKEDIMSVILQIQEIDAYPKINVLIYIINRMTAREKNVESIVNMVLNSKDLESFGKEFVIVNIIENMTIEEQQEKAEIIFDIILKFYENDEILKEFFLANISDTLKKEIVENNPSLKEKINSLQTIKERKVKIIKHNYENKVNSINDFQNMLKELEGIGINLWFLQDELSDFVNKKIDYNKIDVVDIIKSIYEMKIFDDEELCREKCIRDIVTELPIEIQKKYLKQIFYVIQQNQGEENGRWVMEDILEKLGEKNINVGDLLSDKRFDDER